MEVMELPPKMNNRVFIISLRFVVFLVFLDHLKRNVRGQK